jgi:hypothetical protein
MRFLHRLFYIEHSNPQGSIFERFYKGGPELIRREATAASRYRELLQAQVTASHPERLSIIILSAYMSACPAAIQ